MKIGYQVLNIIIKINCLPIFQQQSLLVVLSDYWITFHFQMKITNFDKLTSQVKDISSL